MKLEGEVAVKPTQKIIKEVWVIEKLFECSLIRPINLHYSHAFFDSEQFLMQKKAPKCNRTEGTKGWLLVGTEFRVWNLKKVIKTRFCWIFSQFDKILKNSKIISTYRGIFRWKLHQVQLEICQKFITKLALKSNSIKAVILPTMEWKLTISLKFISCWRGLIE